MARYYSLRLNARIIQQVVRKHLLAAKASTSGKQQHEGATASSATSDSNAATTATDISLHV